MICQNVRAMFDKITEKNRWQDVSAVFCVKEEMWLRQFDGSHTCEKNDIARHDCKVYRHV